MVIVTLASVTFAQVDRNRYNSDSISTYSTFENYIAAKGDTVTTLKIGYNYTINNNLTIPSNIDVSSFFSGAYLTLNGITLTIKKMSAIPTDSVFRGSGTVILDTCAVSFVRTSWFGPGITATFVSCSGDTLKTHNLKVTGKITSALATSDSGEFTAVTGLRAYYTQADIDSLVDDVSIGGDVNIDGEVSIDSNLSVVNGKIYLHNVELRFYDTDQTPLRDSTIWMNKDFSSKNLYIRDTLFFDWQSAIEGINTIKAGDVYQDTISGFEYIETETLIADSATINGKVGIGTSTPTNRLTLDGGGSTQYFEMKNGSSNNRFLVGNDGIGGTTFYSTTSAGADSPFYFYTGSNRRVTIDDSGKVGILDPTPDYRLDVAGTINTDSGYRINGGDLLSSFVCDSFMITLYDNTTARDSVMAKYTIIGNDVAVTIPPLYGTLSGGEAWFKTLPTAARPTNVYRDSPFLWSNGTGDFRGQVTITSDGFMRLYTDARADLPAAIGGTSTSEYTVIRYTLY